ncbi:MAG: NAD-dependent epimerase/dehydratase family protein [Clostridia bacterium]|nr:NAD-dependent epimerase/dehydratase family protein [Clostridia bacterium]
MKVLITGARGFLGRNLTEALNNIKDGKNRTRPGLKIDRLYLYDADCAPEELETACRDCDFVFHLAGVNRPKDPAAFRTGNAGFTGELLSLLKQAGNRCPVMLSSSVQATLVGRYAGSPYGESKAEAERLAFDYALNTGARVLVYRLPNLFGKWSRPDYNSVVATFCYRLARGLPITVNDPAAELELLYIDDLVAVLLDALEGRVSRCRYEGAAAVPDAEGDFCYAPGAHRARLGEIAETIRSFTLLPETFTVPPLPEGSFEKKLYSTFLSFLPAQNAAYPLCVHADERGSFTELLKTDACGQFSVNVIKPGITKGQHWHDSKWELFIVVSGEGLIRQRCVGGKDVFEYRVSGSTPTAVRMLPGYTHSITNLSDSEPLITLMWANEKFDPAHPDTFFEPV